MDDKTDDLLADLLNPGMASIELPMPQEISEVTKELMELTADDLPPESSYTDIPAAEAPVEAVEEIAANPSLETAPEGEITEQLEAELATSQALVQNTATAADSAPDSPYFSLLIRNFQDQRPIVEKLINDLELKVPHSQDIAEGKALLLTRLDEYRALVLFQELWSHEITLEWQPAPAAAPNDLSPAAFTEIGAPSVALAAAAKSVWVSTQDTFPGRSVEEVLGLISTHRSLPRRFFREHEAQTSLDQDLEKLINKTGTVPENHYEILLIELSKELQDKALSLGGNAVVGVELQFFPEWRSLDRSQEELRILANGTAVRLGAPVDLIPKSL